MRNNIDISTNYRAIEVMYIKPTLLKKEIKLQIRDLHAEENQPFFIEFDTDMNCISEQAILHLKKLGLETYGISHVYGDKVILFCAYLKNVTDWQKGELPFIHRKFERLQAYDVFVKQQKEK